MVDDDPALVFERRAGFDSAVNITLAMSAIAFAVIGFADKFRSKVFLRVMGLVMLGASLVVSFTFSVEFGIYLRRVRQQDLPPFVYRNVLITYLVCFYLFMAMMLLVGAVFVYRKAVLHVKF